MARRSSRTRSGRVPSELRGQGSPVPESLADEVLDDPARLFQGRSDPGYDQYVDLIRTGLSDSRVPRPYGVPGVMRSPWAQVRASGRTVGLRREVARAARVDPLSRKLAAQLPQRALSCARRSIRREVIFALRKQGKGAGARRRRRDFNSKHRC